MLNVPSIPYICLVTTKPEEGTGSLNLELYVIMSLMWGAGNLTWVFWKTSHTSNCRFISPALKVTENGVAPGSVLEAHRSDFPLLPLPSAQSVSFLSALCGVVSIKRVGACETFCTSFGA